MAAATVRSTDLSLLSLVLGFGFQSMTTDDITDGFTRLRQLKVIRCLSGEKRELSYDTSIILRLSDRENT